LATSRNTDRIALSQAGQEEVRRLIVAGSMVAAVARVRELTGAGLRQSKEYVDNLAAELGSR
jgi:ribosomal protein L7/L12